MHITDDDPVAFSRTASSDVFGKLDDTLPEVRMDHETVMRLQRGAHDCGMTLTEYHRTVLRGHAWGAEHVANVNAERIRRVLANVPTLQGAAS